MRTRLKEIMKEKHISGTKLAMALGVTPSYVNSAVRGRTELSIKQCEKIANILDVPLAALFDGYVKPDCLYCPHCGKPIRLSEA